MSSQSHHNEKPLPAQTPETMVQLMDDKTASAASDTASAASSDAEESHHLLQGSQSKDNILMENLHNENKHQNLQGDYELWIDKGNYITNIYLFFKELKKIKKK